MTRRRHPPGFTPAPPAAHSRSKSPMKTVIPALLALATILAAGCSPKPENTSPSGSGTARKKVAFVSNGVA